MSHVKVTNIFISDGTALPTGGASITTLGSGDVGVIKSDMTEMTAGQTVADSDILYFASKDSNSLIKRSVAVPGRGIKSFRGRSYQTASREVWAIGHNRVTTTGTLEANNSTLYSFSIEMKGAKNNYSQRPLRFQKTFTTDASASQAEIAAAMYNAIVNDTALAALVDCIIVADGTGAPSQTISGASYTVFGGTGATDYGVEITGKTLTQFSTSYTEVRVRFECNVDDNSGFGTTTTCARINAANQGTGTYQEIYNMENFDLGYEGVLNRTKFPIPTQTYTSSSSYILSSAITPTVTATAGEDIVTFSASVSGILEAGDKVTFTATEYEIKYFISTTVAVVYATTSAVFAGATVKKRVQYDVITIEFEDKRTNDVVNTKSEGAIVIAVPAINSGSAYNTQSTAGADLLAVLNPYMASVGFANITI